MPPRCREEEDHDDSDEWIELAPTAGSDEAPIVLSSGPALGRTRAVPRFRQDLAALITLSAGDKSMARVIRGKFVLTAYYGFVDASSGRFGATVDRKDGMHGRFGIWGCDAECASSNYRELRNMVTINS